MKQQKGNAEAVFWQQSDSKAKEKKKTIWLVQFWSGSYLVSWRRQEFQWKTYRAIKHIMQLQLVHDLSEQPQVLLELWQPKNRATDTSV